MTQEHEYQRQSEPNPAKKMTRVAYQYICAAAIFLLVVGYFLLFHMTTHTLQLGSHTIRVPVPGRAGSPDIQKSGMETIFVDSLTKTAYAIILTSEEAYTAEEFAELLANMPNPVPANVPGLRDSLAKRFIEQQLRIPLNNMFTQIYAPVARVYIENDMRVMIFTCQLAEHGVTSYLSCARLMFLVGTHPYLITVLANSASPITQGATLKKVIKWRDQIVKANPVGKE